MSDKLIYSDLKILGEAMASKLTITGEYSLPIVDGSVGQVIMTDGAGNSTFQSITGFLTPTSIINGTGINWTQLSPTTIQGNVTLAPFSTTNLAEGVNLYYTGTRVNNQVASLIQPGLAGTGPNSIAWTYNAGLGTLTPTVSLTPFSTSNLVEGTRLYFTNERVDDRVAALLQTGTTGAGPASLTWSYNDPANTLTPVISLAPFTTDNLSEGTTNIYFTNERVDDRVAALIQNSSTIVWTYNDFANTLCADATGVSAINVQKNGSLCGTRSTVNFKEGTGVTFSIIDDIGNGRVNVEAAVNLTGLDTAVIKLGAGPGSSVRIDACNTASGLYPTTSGGKCNLTENSYSTISGGYCNKITGEHSTIGGGLNNSIIRGGIGMMPTAFFSGTVTDGTYSVTQDLTANGGFGATFDITIVSNTITSIVVTNPGQNYDLLYDTITIYGTQLSAGGGTSPSEDIVLEVYGTSANYSTIGGGYGNFAGSSCNGYSTIGGGGFNCTTGEKSTISGGYYNIAGNCNVTIGGGAQNIALEIAATVGGGIFNIVPNGAFISTISGGAVNTASGYGATIGGGLCNTTSGCNSTIGGGINNIASHSRATIGGGINNSICGIGSGSTIGGGGCNIASCYWTTVSGGYCNSATLNNSTVSGGYGNIASCSSTIGGGRCNIASGYISTVSGGYFNSAIGGYAAVDGGFRNTADGGYAAVGGGYCNAASCNYATVGGGYCNCATGSSAATVGGGFCNIASCYWTTVSGGYCNSATLNNSTVGGGYCNSATCNSATVSGGCKNIASLNYATVGGGGCNTASGCKSTISGGCRNIASCNYSTVGGGGCNTASCSSTIGGGFRNTASNYYSTVGGGNDNTASGYLSTIGGGFRNTASCNYSTVGGGFCNISAGKGSTIGGGGYVTGEVARRNEAYSLISTIGGGGANKICVTADGGTIGGGCFNILTTNKGRPPIIGGGSCNSISGSGASILGGRENTASGDYSSVAGGLRGSTTRHGERAYSSGVFSASGDAQHVQLIARNVTADDIADLLYLNGTTDLPTIGVNQIISGTVNILGVNTTGTVIARYLRQVTISNIAGTTALTGAVVTLGTDVAGGTSIAITADDTSDALHISVTGVIGSTIRWIAQIDGVQITI